jgi:hypothetical protein
MALGGADAPASPLLDGADARAIPLPTLAQLKSVPEDLLRSLVRCAAQDLTQDKLRTPDEILGELADEAACVAAVEARVPGIDATGARGVYTAVCAAVALCARENTSHRCAFSAPSCASYDSLTMKVAGACCGGSASKMSTSWSC